MKADNAVKTLKQLGANISDIEGKDLVKKRDFLKILAKTGIRIEVEEPSLEDYQNVEKRACLHLPPQPPNTKSDEMRDLVIWEIALRVSKKHGKAILVSRDEVHSHDRGADEAKGVGLLRATSLDEALDLIGRESPSAKLVHSILETIWPAILKAGLPVPPKMVVRRVFKPEFMSTAAGRTNATFGFVIDGSSGKLAGTAQVRQVAADWIDVTLRNVTVDDRQWKDGQVELGFRGELPKIANALGERLNYLEEIIGGQK